MTTALEISQNPQIQDAKSIKYTVITFAPVQGFIEKSRKLRDLYGASQILSYLSWKIVCAAKNKGFEVISPVRDENDNSEIVSSDIVQGMPNRILIAGDFCYNDATNALMEGWTEIVTACREWLETQPELSKYFPSVDPKEGWEEWRLSWKRWRMNAWEIFRGGGEEIGEAMRDLETRKLRRGWTVPNWNGESSSLSGHDAIAYPNMDQEITKANKRNEANERGIVIDFYQDLASALEKYSEQKKEPKFLDASEKLSIPELIKRLVTHQDVSLLVDQKANNNRVIKRGDPQPVFRIDSFSELIRKDDKSGETYWTGWFMGDGDEVGKHLKKLSLLPNPNDAVTEFSTKLRAWELDFQDEFKQERRGRVVYAGGDDFLGVMYSDQKSIKLKGSDAIDWLIRLRENWRGEDKNSEQLGIKLSVGFVWAGHSVTQRDVLQHCREAEKLAKNLGRDRVTIRVVFNNGQYVQWTTPWKYLAWLKDYRDRDGGTNWSHVYGDLAMLRARHAIPPESAKNQDSAIALALLDLYFTQNGVDDKLKKSNILSSNQPEITGNSKDKDLIQWIENMINVGWQLCSIT